MAVPSATLPDLDVEGGYAIQRALVERRLAAGESALGWKIGMASAVGRTAASPGPIYGRLLSGMLVEDGGTIERARLHGPHAEAEIAVVLARSLRGPGVTVADVRAAAAGVRPAIEVFATRLDAEAPGLPDSVADDSSSAHFALAGPVTPLDDLDLRLVGVVFSRGDAIAGTGAGGQVGDPLRAGRLARERGRRARRRAARRRRDPHGRAGRRPSGRGRRRLHRRARPARLGLGGLRMIAAALAGVPRTRLATLPTPLEAGPALPGGARLLVKRDDLTGLGMGGNKARKLEFLCGAAREQGADVLVTVGAEQSNHARMSAAAGAVLGLETHLVLGGDPAAPASGNRLLAELFGATVHQPGSEDWAVLSAELERVTAGLREAGRRPFAFPLGGSTATGALGFLLAFEELMEQCGALGVHPSAIVFASSTGGTHGGLLAGRAAYAAAGAPVPDVTAIGVAKEPGRDLAADAGRLAEECLALAGLPGAGLDAPPALDERWLGPGYAVPSADGDAAVAWAARHGGWVLDRTYAGKGLGGLLGRAGEGRHGPGDTVVFWHTGGQPAVFAPGGAPI